MFDVRMSTLGDHTVVELRTQKAKNWYSDNVPGAPAVCANSVVLDIGRAERLAAAMKGHLIIKIGED